MIEGIIVDNFAGGGGASEGIELALGQPVDIAKNHDREAIAMHRANHPGTWHLCEDVWSGDPVLEVAEASRRRGASGPLPVALAWFSPDCKHFSKAKGGKPVEKKIRDLAWVVVRWAEKVRPAVIMLENVEEFRDWGPLIEVAGGKMMPCPVRKGLEFRRWRKALEDLGYQVEDRELRACDYGSPTIRKRLFVIARCDGRPIVWPAPTHARGGQGGLLPWRAAAECIDWSLPCPSIFERDRDLAENTLRRIAAGVRRYVIEAAEPFIVPRYGERAGQAPRTSGVHAPFNTVTPDANVGSLVMPLIARIGQTGGNGKYANGVDEPLTTATTKAEHLLVAPHLTKFRTGSIGNDLRDPGPTVTANSYIKRPGGAPPLGVVAAFLAQHNGGMVGHTATDPLSTSTAKRGPQQLVMAHLLNLKGSDRRMGPATQPAPAITSQGKHVAEVRAFLIKYFSAAEHGQMPDEPLHTVTAKPRFGLVYVHGEPYEIVDIGMRMLTPRELFRAQGFGDHYIIDPYMDDRRGKKGQLLKPGPIPIEAQVRMCGNSVCPDLAEALVRANVVETGIDYGRAAARMAA